jgi:phospholipase/carboxylesterase
METESKALKTVELGHYDEAEYSMIWLHGLGADGNDFVSIIPELKLPDLNKFHFVFPHAPVRPLSLNAGMPMRAWFDLYSLDESGPIDEEGIQEAIKSIHHLIDIEIQHGIKPEKIFLAGFSQGGYIALLSGLFYPKSLAGLIGLSTFIWQTKDFEQRLHLDNQHTPIFLAHGRHDPLVPLKYGEHTDTLLKSKGYNLSLHIYPMAHTVCEQEIKDLSLWISRVKSHNED